MERTIKAVAPLRTDVQEARRILRDAPASVLGPAEHDERGLAPRRFHTTVPAVVGSGATVEHDVLMELGRVPGDEQPVVVEFSLHPVGHASVLPVFEGELVIEPSGAQHGANTLTVRGTYTAPLGPIGHVGDSLVGRRVARSSMEVFAARIAIKLDETGSVGGRRRRARR